eukprot:CAMPEP_0113639868 /NCGR_PEP_ID=MMETSP0017_2-20120614/20922_1 /TAXON_ID=2856 /ORGANISM="Cylindrotheca closterium" /LENGTH=163 /DNA_ID=CAMNT_0000551117 /DNA_START=44 /DNA_END=535 /DNA_ORIENTATION=- /assembly_acc=CAM_ASM_000147
MRSFTALFLLPLASAFAPTQLNSHAIQNPLQMAAFEMEVDMPPSGSNMQANLKFDPILDVPSEIIEVRYAVPFGLNVEPQKNLAVCTKDGEGGEKVGDVLRYTSQWTIGLAAMFGGGVSWGCSLFNVMSAKSWEQVVEALVSNVDSRTDEVVLLFERPLEAEN